MLDESADGKDKQHRCGIKNSLFSRLLFYEYLLTLLTVEAIPTHFYPAPFPNTKHMLLQEYSKQTGVFTFLFCHLQVWGNI